MPKISTEYEIRVYLETHFTKEEMGYMDSHFYSSNMEEQDPYERVAYHLNYLINNHPPHHIVMKMINFLTKQTVVPREKIVELIKNI